jgi:hypothetical protein
MSAQERNTHTVRRRFMMTSNEWNGMEYGMEWNEME